MSCRHDLAIGTCTRCYPSNPFDRSERDRVTPGPEEDYESNLEGPGAVQAVSADRPKRHEPIPVIWFNSRGSGPDEFALQLNPLDKLMDGDQLIAPPTLGLMVRAGQLVIMGREMINGGFQIDHDGAAKLHAQIGQWLADNPEEQTP